MTAAKLRKDLLRAAANVIRPQETEWSDGCKADRRQHYGNPTSAEGCDLCEAEYTDRLDDAAIRFVDELAPKVTAPTSLTAAQTDHILDLGFAVAAASCATGADPKSVPAFDDYSSALQRFVSHVLGLSRSVPGFVTGAAAALTDRTTDRTTYAGRSL